MIDFVTGGDFKERVLESKKPVVVWFTVPDCVPCKAIQPRVEEVSREYGKEVLFYRLEIDKFPEIAQEYQIMSTPTLIFFKQGKEVARQDAFPSKKEIVEALKIVVR